MNLKFLETFIWVARLQSFSSAATKLNATQAAISSRIKALEESLGIRLFERDMRSAVRLTPEGRESLARAEELVRLTKDFIEAVSDRNAIRGTINIGTMDAVVHAWLPRLINDLQRRFPKILCNVIIDTSQNLATRLHEGLIDVCIVSIPISQKMTKSIRLGTFRSVWIASPALNLPRDRVTLKDVANYPIITFPAGSSSHEALTEILRAASIEARIFTANSTMTILRLVADGVGIAAAPVVNLTDMISAGVLRALPMEQTFPSLTYYAAYADRPDDVLPRIAAEMAEEIARGYLAE